ncbi:DUF979 domain-containing protein [Atopobacter sp. AH10]|uniref:DUF979 domain-containing protein n=1 Tax=Atopobacter sp. AH10 TaxID=2315861 RepID=UPI000EF2619C|nr:DUF979 domain-containing protein [Atopobacter sp. AH10]RLK62585.1 DUF979 domain-containing protein [Atopobacter sp. AH10]
MSVDLVLEIICVLMGIQLFHTSYRAFIDASLKSKRLGTGAFWLLLAILFALGSYLPNVVNGGLVCLLGVLTLFKQVELGSFKVPSSEQLKERADRIGWLIFLPVIFLSVGSLALGLALPEYGKVAIGLGAVLGLIAIFLVTKASGKEFLEENNRMVQQVSPVSILPQILTALGAIFTTAGVGELVSKAIGGLIPAGNQFVGAFAYCLGMFIFTIVMGNAFAAFTVITAGIGIPFVFAQGGDPIVAGALAMTAGFCGTLITPMAGNFNALPAALMEMKSEYGVIKQQAIPAFTLLFIHVLLMYFLAF